MKRITLLVAAYSIIIGLPIKAQNSFNKLIYFDFISTRLSGVVATDTCYYIKGSYVDSISPWRTGLVFCKVDLDGNVKMINTIYNPEKEYGNSYGNFIETNDNNLLEMALVGDTITRALLIKYTPQGDSILTQKYYNVLYPDSWYLVPRAIRQKNDGGFAALFGHLTIAETDFDISLLLLDSNYNIQQYKVLGSTPLQETATALILDGDGGYVVGASRENSNYVTQNYTFRTLLIKTDSNGNPVWQWLSPANELWGEAEQLIKTPDGGLVVASRKGIEVVANATVSIIKWDANVFKLDADRNLVWSTSLRGYHPTSGTGLTEMVEATDGSGYVVTGQMLDSISGPEVEIGTWLAKVSSGADSLWARYFTWYEDEYLAPQPWGMSATPDGGYIVVGTTLNVGQHVPGWVLKVDSFGCLVPGCHLPNATVDQAEPEIKLSIYPNPTEDFLNFYVNAPNPAIGATFRIISAEGKLVSEFNTSNLPSTFIIPVHDWTPGIYFLLYLESGQIILTEKFIKT